MIDWFTRPLDRRAPRGGELGVNDRLYRGGEFMPFYVPRAVMPQIEEEDYDAFFAFCGEWNITLTHLVVDPIELRPHQQVDKFKAEHMSSDVLAKPALVSEDFFILDGNHRWMAHLLLKAPIHVIVVSLHFEPAIEFLFRFPRTRTITREFE